MPKREPRIEIRRYFGGRARALAAVVTLSLGGSVCSPRPPEQSVQGLAAFLSERSETSVAEADIAWEPSAGAFADFVAGRALVFLGASADTATRDVFRARIRLTPSGQPLSLVKLARLTETPLADEAGLHVASGRALFASMSQGGVQALSVLELAGTRSEEWPEGLLGRLLARLRARLELGTFDGLGRTDIVFEEPPPRLAFRAEGGLLKLARSDVAPILRYDLEARSFRGDGAREAHVLHRAEPRVGLGALERHLARRRPVEAFANGDSPFRATSSAVAGKTVEFIALDMRRLELGFQAGLTSPAALLGPPGAGRLSKGALPNVLAVFALGARTNGGAMADGRLLAPARHLAPTVAVTRLGDAGIGPWPWQAPDEPGVRAFVQLDAIALEGDTARAPADAETTRRSALCLRRDGGLSYAFSTRIDARALGGALRSAECTFAVALTRGSETTGFALTRFGADASVARFSLANAAMDLRAYDVLRASPHGFFYLLDSAPRPPSEGGTEWRDSPGAQPPPRTRPAVFEATDRLGALSVKLISFEAARATFRLRPGRREPGAQSANWAGVFATGPAGESLGAFGLGHSTEVTRYGLRLGSNVALLLKGGYATLVLDPGRAPRIVLPSETLSLTGNEEAVQLPLLADERGVEARARERGSFRRRAALGLAPGGHVVVAEVEHDSSDPLIVSLRRIGCSRIVELDRGSHHPAFVFRAAERAEAPPAGDATVLHVFSRAMPPHTLSALEDATAARPARP